MTCPNCGASTQPGAVFCPNCGASLAAAMPQLAPPAPAKKKPNTLLIVGIIAIVAVLIIGAAAMASASSKKTTGVDDNDDTPYTPYTPPPTTNTPTTEKKWLTNVNYYEWTSDNQFMQPDAGNRFVQIIFTFTNQGSTEAILNPYYFTMYTTGGVGYGYSWEVEYTMADSLQPGSSVQCTLGFEIPVGATPNTLKYDPW